MVAANNGTRYVALTDDALAPIKDGNRGVTDFDTRLDYDVRVDTQPVYIGRSLGGTLTSAPTWVIERLTYDASSRVIFKQTLTGSWDGRTSLAWT